MNYFQPQRSTNKKLRLEYGESKEMKMRNKVKGETRNCCACANFSSAKRSVGERHEEDEVEWG